MWAVLTEEHHQEEALHYKGWDYRDPLDHLGLLDQGHHPLDTMEPGQNRKETLKLRIS